MGIREDLVASAAQFLKEPSVAQSPVETRIAFLRQKNLTQDEIDAALSRAAGTAVLVTTTTSTAPTAPQYSQPQQYQYAPYSHPQQPPPIPQRDWRDWFIMATVMGGVGYGIYALGKRYVYPLIAPPTATQMEQDKAHLDAQFDRAFALVEQLAADTDKLKSAEQERTEKLDAALAELDSVITEMKTSARERQDKMRDLREEVRILTNKIPNMVDEQNAATDTRLKEINRELLSLKTLIERVTQSPVAAASPSASTNVVAPGPLVVSSGAPSPAETGEKAVEEVGGATGIAAFRSSTLAAGVAGKAKIPAWQLAMEEN